MSSRVQASPPWYYIAHSPAFLAPWFALAATALWTRWREQRFYVNWILAVLVPYSLMSSKLDVYMMALIPPMALVIADCVANRLDAAWRANLVMLVALLVIGIACFFVHVPVPTIGIGAAFIVASIGGLFVSTRDRFTSTIAVGLVPLVVLVFVALRLMPEVNELASDAPLIRALVAQHIDPAEIALYSCPYLWSRDMPRDLERVRYVTPQSFRATNARLVVTSRRHAKEIDLTGYTKAGELQMIGKPFDVYRR